MTEHPNIIHLNGTLIPADQARISPFDRGFIFGDSVYEGIRATEGHIIALGRHAARMANGLRECRITGFDPAQLDQLSRELLEANGLIDAFIYWQISRGTPTGTQPWRGRIPAEGMVPTVLGVTIPADPVAQIKEPDTRTAVVRPDTRWLRGLVKSTSLLGNVLASIEADEAGAEDAILVREGLVAEATASNIFFALGDTLVTPSLDSLPILAGVTRDLILEADPSIEQRPVGVDEMHAADEIMLVGTRTMVTAVTSLDGQPVGSGTVGPHARALLQALLDAIQTDIHSSHA